ncbi:MAG: thioether cross-link-forming SCIFF peptide maturase [Clostridiales bacterium]|jgi:uncharacterized protein|nr:thioether cross-link-forming SCIFF peptide maturase [Eubacteriales bacterium]MDH7565315.1 thioether cross-link-forming SCIFF peptide maturase [Clostridiales bacterium]
MIHKFTLFGTNIVVDTNSGAVHVFDDVAYDILDYYKEYNKEGIEDKLRGKYSKQQVEEALEEISALEKDGLLYSKDTYDEYALKGHLSAWSKNIKALCLHVSHDCNLRCKYCFASTGNFGGERTVMTPEIGKRSIDFLIKESGNRRNLEIDFFGGEPLLNFSTVVEVVEYAKKRGEEAGKRFKFTITTNALLLNEEIKNYINANMHNVVLSIDGRKETNDRMRYRVDGSGTYEDIMPVIKSVAESRNQDNYYVRGTYTRHNLDFSRDVLHLADEGFKQISVEPVVAAKGTGYDLREEDLDVLYKEYERLAEEYVNRREKGRGFNFFHFMIDLGQGPCLSKRLGGCGSGHEYMAVTPEGDIYPCHQFVGMKEFKMGNVREGFLNREIQELFKRSNVYAKQDCRECWAKFYCSGGCAANAYQFNGDINVPYKIGCALEKKRVECALWIKTRE